MRGLKTGVAQWRVGESGRVSWGGGMSKSDGEVNAARKGCAIGGRAWKRALADVHSGITGAELQQLILGYYYDEGADLTSAPPTTLGATGEKGRFQDGDVLYLDGRWYRRNSRAILQFLAYKCTHSAHTLVIRRNLHLCPCIICSGV